MLDKLTSVPNSAARPFPARKSSAFRFSLLLTLTVIGGLGFVSCGFFGIKADLLERRGDTIHFTFGTTNPSYNPYPKDLYGVLIDGSREGQCLNDYIQRVDSNQVMYIGNFTDACPVGAVGAAGEIIAFTKGHPPTILDVPWTTGFEPVNLRFQNEYPLQVQIWIVSGDETAQHAKAVLALTNTIKTWYEERQGFSILRNSNDIDTGHQDQALLNFDCSMAQRLVTGRRRPGVINIYYVDKVIDENGVYSRGQGINCGAVPGYLNFKNVIVMGSETSPTLLAHELGHSFGLNHVGHLSELDVANVMHESSMVRIFLTEGQTFRQAFQTDSAINTIYSGYLGGRGFGITLPPSRACFPFTGAAWESGAFHFPNGTIDIATYEQNARECPLLQTRIWVEKYRTTQDTLDVVLWSYFAP